MEIPLYSNLLSCPRISVSRYAFSFTESSTSLEISDNNFDSTKRSIYESDQSSTIEAAISLLSLGLTNVPFLNTSSITSLYVDDGVFIFFYLFFFWFLLKVSSVTH